MNSKAEDDRVRRVRPIEFYRDRLRAWIATADALGQNGTPLRLELTDLWGDYCLHRLSRVAMAARYVARVSDEPHKTNAVALAEELEQAAL